MLGAERVHHSLVSVAAKALDDHLVKDYTFNSVAMQPIGNMMYFNASDIILYTLAVQLWNILNRPSLYGMSELTRFLRQITKLLMISCIKL